MCYKSSGLKLEDVIKELTHDKGSKHGAYFTRIFRSHRDNCDICEGSMMPNEDNMQWFKFETETSARWHIECTRCTTRRLKRGSEDG